MWMLWQTECQWLKLIHVKPYHRTSLQYHLRRSELHVSLDRWRWVKVPRFRYHRMNPGWYLEYAWGWPKEEDIVRRADDYGRL